VEDLARISFKRKPLYVGVDDSKEVSTREGLQQGFCVVPPDKRFLLLFTFLKKNINKKVWCFAVREKRIMKKVLVVCREGHHEKVLVVCIMKKVLVVAGKGIMKKVRDGHHEEWAYFTWPHVTASKEVCCGGIQCLSWLLTRPRSAPGYFMLST
jgi:hypothetical protein